MLACVVVAPLSVIEPAVLASMTDEEIASEVVALLRRVVPRDIAECNLSSSLVEDIGIDSLGSYELMMDAEERFGIEITDDQLMELATVGDIVALVKQKLG